MADTTPRSPLPGRSGRPPLPGRSVRRRPPFAAIAIATVCASVAALAVIVVFGNDDTTDDPTAALDVTPRPPDAGVLDLDVTSFDRETFPLRELIDDGTPTIVNFFSSTCVPCVTEMPALEQVHQQLGDRVRFLGLAMQDRPEDALRTADETGITYDIARDPDGTLLAAFGGLVMPTTVFLDADGSIVEVHSGELTEQKVLDKVADGFGITA